MDLPQSNEEKQRLFLLGQGNIQGAFEHSPQSDDPSIFRTTKKAMNGTPLWEDIVYTQPWAAQYPADQKFLIFQHIHLDAPSGLKPYDQRIRIVHPFSMDETVVVFYQCTLPTLEIKGIHSLDWIFINAKVQLELRENSQARSIVSIRNSDSSIFLRDSACRRITLVDGAQGSVTLINCPIQHILIFSEAFQDRISIGSGSKVRKIECWTNRSGIIDLSENTVVDDLEMQFSSSLDFISVSTYARIERLRVDMHSVLEELSVQFGGSVGEIKVINSGQLNWLRLSNDAKMGDLIAWQAVIGDITLERRCEVLDLQLGKNCQLGTIKVADSKISLLQIEEGYCSLVFNHATIGLILLTNCHINHLTWQGVNRTEAYITGGTINYLMLTRGSIPKDAVLSIANLPIHIMKFEELFVHGYLILRNISGSLHPVLDGRELKFLLDYPVDEQNVSSRPTYDREKNIPAKKEFHARQLSEIIEDNKELETSRGRNSIPLLIITNSSMGKTEITGSDLMAFRFEYKDSKCLEMFISGTRFSKERITLANDDKFRATLRDRHAQKISIYNQLKKLYEAQGDIIEGTWYHSKAMDHQEKLLTIDFHDRDAKWHQKVGSDQAFDLFNFKLNKISNNHGESWRKALLFIFATSFPIYLLYYVSINCHKPFSFNGTGVFIGYYFTFLDITHKIDFMGDHSILNGWSRLLDFSGRIMLGYGLYQFIAAFRKHGRKG